MQQIDLTGHTYGMLVVTHKAANKPGFWVARCKCGKQTTIRGASLRNGNTKSCGCLKREARSMVGTVPAKYRKPAPLIDMATYLTDNVELLLKLKETFNAYGVKVSTKNMMYITQHNGVAYGPFDNIVSLLGHLMQHAVGQPHIGTLNKLETWKKGQS